MNKCSIIICFIVFVCSTIVRTELTVEDGGYGNILVSFAQNIPKSNRNKILLDNLKAYLEDASTVLQRAIALRITSVTFLIPKDWDTSEWNVTVGSAVSGQSTSKADILVDGVSDRVFGKFPFAEQYGSCQTPGRQLVIPEAFLTENIPFPKGTFLAREWLKYRYGVFDENGYPRDQLYPLYRSRVNPSDITVTDCSNEVIMYNITSKDDDICSSDNNDVECLVIPNEESLENVSSSLMYYHENIPNMQYVCGKEPGHEHSTLSQNKHNALCRGQSIWDVLKQSKDFHDLKESKPEDEEKIQFNYAQQKNPKVVIALENTEKLKDLGQTALNAIRKFVYDLPKGSKYSFFPYSDAINKEYSLRELNNWPIDWERDSTPLTFSKQTVGCTNCALSKALDIIASENPIGADGTIIIVTADSIDVDKNIRQRLATSKICLMFYVFSGSSVSKDYNEYLSASECGTLVEFSKTETNVTVFKKMFSTMESVLPERIDDKVIETVQTVQLRDGSDTTFSIDETIEKVMFWIFPGKESDAIEVKYEEGSLESLKDELTGDVLALSCVPKSYGKLELRNSYGGEALIQIRTESKPAQYFSGEVLIHDTTEEKSLNQMPVILYVRLRFGQYPVQNAEVRATVSRPGDSDVKLTMFDDGRGNPDITENDGVYSRFFTSFTSKGEYTVTVTVQNNGRDTTAGKDNTKGYQPCCGSYVEKGTLKLNDFIRTFKSSFNAISGRPANGYKPSRIVDLRIEEITDDKVVLTWTAPGGEADEGRVERYDIRYFTSQDDVRNFEKGSPLNYTNNPQSRGSTEIFESHFDNYEKNQLYYIAMKSKTSIQDSDASNIVQVFIIGDEVTSVPDQETKKDNKVAAINKMTIVIITATIVAVIVFVILVYLIVYFAFVKPKQAKEQKKSQENHANCGSEPSENNMVNPITFISASTLMKHHDEKMRAKIEKKDPPVFKEEDFEDNSTPRVNSRENTNMEEDHYHQVTKSSTNNEILPSKSPRRATPV